MRKPASNPADNFGSCSAWAGIRRGGDPYPSAIRRTRREVMDEIGSWYFAADVREGWRQAKGHGWSVGRVSVLHQGDRSALNA